jgi:hypothetical protein
MLIEESPNLITQHYSEYFTSDKVYTFLNDKLRKITILKTISVQNYQRTILNTLFEYEYIDRKIIKKNIFSYFFDKIFHNKHNRYTINRKKITPKAEYYTKDYYSFFSPSNVLNIHKVYPNKYVAFINHFKSKKITIYDVEIMNKSIKKGILQELLKDDLFKLKTLVSSLNSTKTNEFLLNYLDVKRGF